MLTAAVGLVCFRLCIQARPHCSVALKVSTKRSSTPKSGTDSSEPEAPSVKNHSINWDYGENGCCHAWISAPAAAGFSSLDLASSKITIQLCVS